ncbi:hypothetical protein Taro_001820 [Colocasia esculenta]|uniref:Peptidase A1 domain-containing protein n=1 Tax=Colocasia esculenta TaxID=4460 RepID=A0A843TEL7_COLES|nr:hypothetical protein [Colocasia esculenta]
MTSWSFFSAPSGNYLRVVHRHGACSPSVAVKPDHVERLARDSRRVASLQKRMRPAIADLIEKRSNDPQSSHVSIPAKSGDEIGSGDYVVTVGFGTPARQQTVIFDTGSNVCWIQCQPCSGTCYKQKEPIFNPSSSTSYKNVSCDSDACTNLDSSSCSGNTCIYSVQYGDQSSTAGFLATETLTLSSDHVFRNFVFGCGEQNQGLFSGIAGLIGLARSPSSLVAQTSKTLGDVFSYCLPVSSAAGYLSVGKSSASKVVYTPMLADEPAPGLYFIDLVGISVGGSKLPVKPSVFRSGGTIIDSGTVITRLPPSAYSALRSAVRKAMSQYEQAEPVSILDTCYDFKGVQKVSYPTVTLHYDGADVALDLSGIFISVEESVACLAFAGNDDPSNINIIGNIQQRGMEVIYDIGKKNIGFAAGACR